MITFHGDTLVGPEVCRLLYLTVPDELHVPVVFHNRPSAYVGRGALATCHYDQIHVNLNKVFDYAMWQRTPKAPTVGVWRALLESCYHEFGHVATEDERLAVGDSYMSYRRHMYIEGLANNWMLQRIAMLLEHDGRLAQPRTLAGYLGLMVKQVVDHCHKVVTGQRDGAIDVGNVRAALVKEVRCWRTGGQLSAGEALERIGLARSAYRGLRRVSVNMGIDYIDAAGRHHKLYTWGDLPILAERLKRSYPGLFARADSARRWTGDAWLAEISSSAAATDADTAADHASGDTYKPWELNEPCPACNRVAWRQRPGNGWICIVCEPDPGSLAASGSDGGVVE